MSLKDKLMHAAEVADAWRVVPRTVLVAYGWLVYESSFWFMNLPDPSNTQMGLVSSLLGVAGIIIGVYLKSGRDWTKKDD